MSSIGTGYDLFTSTFSPDGRVFQVEYAFKAVDASGLVVGLRCSEGVVLAVERIIATKLFEKDSNERICNVDDHVGFASAGLYPDGEALSDYCVQEAQNYYNQYRTRISTKHMADRLAMYMHAYTIHSGVRPYGACVLLAGADKKGDSGATDSKEPGGKQDLTPCLYMIDPAGLSYGYHGIAVGRNKQPARTEIEKLKLNNMSLEDCVKAAARIVYAVRDETKDKRWSLELSWVNGKTGKHEKVPKALATTAEDEARRALEEMDDDDMD